MDKLMSCGKLQLWLSEGVSMEFVLSWLLLVMERTREKGWVLPYEDKDGGETLLKLTVKE